MKLWLRCFLGSVLMLGSSLAQGDIEAALKVGFIYNFLKFIQWEKRTDLAGGYRICITKSNVLGDELMKLKEKTVNGVPISVQHIVNKEDLPGCHLVYFDQDDEKIFSFSGPNVVTVGEKNGFIEQGGIIGFVHYDNHLGFEVNLDAAKTANIFIDARMLNLAKKIISTKP